MPEAFDERVKRYAKAIWKSEVEAGNCTTDWPITAEVERALLDAATAAVQVLG